MSWRRQIKFYLLKFLRLKDMPSKVALGFAVGACVNFYPTFGFGVIIAGLLATLIKGNITAGLIGDILFKPMFPVLFYLDLLTGDLIFSSKTTLVWRSIHTMGSVNGNFLLVFGQTFFLGAVINSIVFGVILFIIIISILKHKRLALLNFVRDQK